MEGKEKGDICSQNVSGTTFEYLVLGVKQTWGGIEYCYVENLETRHKQFIKSTELKTLKDEK